jgi:hypothetical protein
MVPNSVLTISGDKPSVSATILLGDLMISNASLK